MRTARSLLTLFFAVGSAAAQAQDYPRTIVDDRNQSVVIERAPRTVASISTFGADVMVALDRQVAGLSTLNNQRSAFLGDAAAKAVNLGEVHQTNLEVLAKLSPDLTIGLRTYTEPFAKKIEETGAFLAFDLITLNDSVSAVERATRALGADSQGAAMNQAFLDELEATGKRAPGRSARFSSGIGAMLPMPTTATT
ncbi:hypothetical protein P4133_11605 [Pseudomonas aeruginosa]|nr:hypothetical protein [Pseudomonas aeruginosa]MDF5992025.1 hypothetical protein [Pseudomonas aeruginosa]MDF6001916.1 hypothetical protein [Pseudomonas aeruginosa]MDW0129331.1 hypothetical protein [Pseudomonas aeruginosa]